MSTSTALPWGHALTLHGRPWRLANADGTGTAASLALRRSTSGATVLIYPWEHYAYWTEMLGRPLPEFAFGEQTSTIGLLEHEVFVGDTFRWGSATLQVAGPGPAVLPPALAGYQRAQPDLGGRVGFRVRILSPGVVSLDDEISLLDVDELGISIADVARVLAAGPAAAGMSAERVLLAQHLFPTEFVDGLVGGGADCDDVSEGDRMQVASAR